MRPLDVVIGLILISVEKGTHPINCEGNEQRNEYGGQEQMLKKQPSDCRKTK
jgi:hypothetical protein